VTVVRSDEATPLALVGAFALVVLLFGLALRWSAALAIGVSLLGAQQATRLALGPDALDEATPLVAGSLLLVAELAWWSIEPRIPAWAQPSVAMWRVVTVVFCCAGGTVAAAVVVVAAGAPVSGGTPLLLIGIVAATTAIGVVATAVRKSVVE